MTFASGARNFSGTGPVQFTSEYPIAARSASCRSDPASAGAILSRYCTRLTSSSPSFAPSAWANAAPAEPFTTTPLSTDRPFAAARAASWRSMARPKPRRRTAGWTTGPMEARSRFSRSHRCIR